MAAKRTNGAGTGAADDAFEDAREAASGGASGLLADLADKLGASARAEAVFGQPVERDGLTVIPVAQAMWGSGAGSGTSEQDGFGSGAGGGVLARPLGYIELSGTSAAYVPLQKPWQDVKLVLGWALAAWLVARAIRLLLG